MAFSPFKILDYFSFGKNRVAQEKENLTELVHNLSGDLIPWSKKDAELLSFGTIEKKIYKGDSAKGIFVSIYDEPMMAFATKEFNRAKLTKMTIAHTKNHKFFYLDTPKAIQCYFNDQQIGFMKEDYMFYSMKKRLAGRINSGGHDSYSTVIYKDAELGLINPLSFDSPFSKRVFDLINDKLTTEGEIILMCLTFYYLIDKLSKS
jgi:hypothetical protein